MKKEKDKNANYGVLLVIFLIVGAVAIYRSPKDEEKIHALKNGEEVGITSILLRASRLAPYERWLNNHQDCQIRGTQFVSQEDGSVIRVFITHEDTKACFQ